MAEGKRVTIRVGDCVELMGEMEAASVDTIVTDPPYGLSFMGKDWDTMGRGNGQQAWHRLWADQALRVLKLGGHLVAFGGSRTYHRMASAVEDAGFEIRDQLQWLYGQGFPKSRNLKGEWQGWGTALKPAHEPIVLARKPLVGTVAANVLAWGTGALNVDGCRIPADGRPHIESKSEPSLGVFGDGLNGSRALGVTSEGRWPANVLLDEEAAAMLDEQSGIQKDGTAVQRNGGGRALFGGIAGNKSDGARPDDAGFDGSGGASRFFYCAKASTKERNLGLTERNPHPTVKPVALMRWLVRLVTPPGGTVLDPFMGSGTTGIAALEEGFDFIGFEQDAEYVKIAQTRIGWWDSAVQGKRLKLRPL